MMLDYVTPETLVAGALIGVSALALLGCMVMLWKGRRPSPRLSSAEIDEIVRRAPYHRLAEAGLGMGNVRGNDWKTRRDLADL